jgi:hypothetical protein
VGVTVGDGLCDGLFEGRWLVLCDGDVLGLWLWLAPDRLTDELVDELVDEWLRLVDVCGAALPPPPAIAPPAHTRIRTTASTIATATRRRTQ